MASNPTNDGWTEEGEDRSRIRIVEVWEPAGPDEFGPLLIGGVPYKRVSREVVDEPAPIEPPDDE